MGKNKKGGMVYSTNPNYEYESEEEIAEVAPQDQNLRLRIETKHRGGKVVVIIGAFAGPDSAGKELCKKIKQFCGTGGSYKEGEIVIQGRMIEKVRDFLNKNHYRFKG